MEKVIQKIQELYGTLQSAISAVAQERSAIAKREESVQAHQQFLIEREADLDAREIEIKKIEDVVAFDKSAKEKWTLLKKELIKLDDLKAAHERKAQEDSERIRQIKADIDNQRAEIKAQKESNMKTRKALEREKAEYKAKIIEELKSKV